MKKRLVGAAILMTIPACILTAGVSAASVIDSGQCGDNLTWTLYNDELVIFSCADIDGNGKVNTRDWNTIRDHINKSAPLW